MWCHCLSVVSPRGNAATFGVPLSRWPWTPSLNLLCRACRPTALRTWWRNLLAALVAPKPLPRLKPNRSSVAPVTKLAPKLRRCQRAFQMRIKPLRCRIRSWYLKPWWRFPPRSGWVQIRCWTLVCLRADLLIKSPSLHLGCRRHLRARLGRQLGARWWYAVLWWASGIAWPRKLFAGHPAALFWRRKPDWETQPAAAPSAVRLLQLQNYSYCFKSPTLMAWDRFKCLISCYHLCCLKCWSFFDDIYIFIAVSRWHLYGCWTRGNGAQRRTVSAFTFCSSCWIVSSGIQTHNLSVISRDLLNTVSLFCFRVDLQCHMVTEPATESKPEPEIVQTEVRKAFCCGFYSPLLMRETTFTASTITLKIKLYNLF